MLSKRSYSLVSAGIRLALAAACLTGTTGIIRADIIPVQNAGFETLPITGLPLTAGCPAADCSYDSGVTPPDWTFINSGGGTVGQFQPGAVPSTLYESYPAGDGPTFGYVGGNGELYQTVSTTIVAGLTYTLTVDVGTAKPPIIFNSPFVELWAGNTTTGSLLVSDNPSPTAGDWETVTLTYVSLLNDPNAGQQLTIVLGGSIDNGLTRADFDNVRLSDNAITATPEPSSLWILLTGVALLLVFRRRAATLG